MALTKDFRETIRERAQREPQFRKALLREAIELMLSGDRRRAGRSCATISTPQSASGTWRRRHLSRQTA